jgi:hypothetical protein
MSLLELAASGLVSTPKKSLTGKKLISKNMPFECTQVATQRAGEYAYKKQLLQIASTSE